MNLHPAVSLRVHSCLLGYWCIAMLPGLSMPAGAEDKPLAEPAVVLQSGERIVGPVVTVGGGKLQIGGPTPREVPLDEVAQVELVAADSIAGTWLGQDGKDLVGPSAASGGNGIQDVHVQLAGLPRLRTIKQIVVACRDPAHTRGWRLDPADSPDWRLGIALQHAAGTADLYLEPDAADALGQQFSIEVTFADEGTASSAVQAATHTSDKLAANAAAATGDAAAAAEVGLPVTVYLASRDALSGSLVALDDRWLELAAPWRGKLRIPTAEAAAMRFGDTGGADAAARFEKLRAEPPPADAVLVVGPDQALAQVDGAVQGLAGGKLQIEFEGQQRGIAAARVAAVAFAARPPRPSSVAPFQIFELHAGGKLSGTWTAIEADRLVVATPWGESVQLPRAAVRRIEFRNGAIVYLSDLEPARVEETPYFSRRMPYQRDKSLTGGPLQMAGQTYARGLALHSRCVLVYELGGAFAEFHARVGFDDAALGRGRAAVRVLADEREVFAAEDLRGDAKPVAFDADIAGAARLTLEVDFGQHEDIGDRVIFADARLARQR